MGDVFQAVYPLIGRSELSSEMANFGKELATVAFSSFYKSYESSDLRWLRDEVSNGCTTAQGYFALYTLPPELLTPSCVLAILKVLVGTPYWAEAVANLEDETENGDVRKLLREWLSMGVDDHGRLDVERMAGINQ